MTSDRAPKCEEDTHFLTKRAKKVIWRIHLWLSLVEAWRDLLSQASMATFIISLTHSLYYFVWAKLFLSINEECFSSLSTLVLCVCVASSSCLCVEAPTLFLSSYGFKNKLPHSLLRAHMEIRRASMLYWRGMVCVCEAHHWNLKCPWCWVCMHRSEVVGECCLECSSGLTNASLHLIEWGNEKYLCVCFGECVCVSGVLVDHNRSLFSLRLRRASMLTDLGRVLGLTRD